MRRAFPLLCLVASCATLADGHAGLDNPPSMNAGPFRLLIAGELGFGSPAPFVVDDQDAFYRDVSVIADDDDATTFTVDGYFAASTAADALPDRVSRLTGVDGRSFDRGSAVDVLHADLDWEGGTVGAPSVTRSAGAVLLAYAGASGIGIATSADGVSFTKDEGPALASGFGGWFGGVPRSPGVVALPDGSFRLFYEADGARGVSIGEARSADGHVFTPVGDGPVLEPAVELDAGGAGSPAPVLATSEEGRAIVFVYYTAIAADGTHKIGMAARFVEPDPDAPLVRSESAMLAPSSKRQVREPSVVRFADFSFLFATENDSNTSTDPAVLASIAPGLATLPKANPP